MYFNINDLLPEQRTGTILVYNESLNAESEDSKESSAAEQFWVAYSALSLSNVDQLLKGMQSAIEIQRAILRQGSSAITKTGFM